MASACSPKPSATRAVVPEPSVPTVGYGELPQELAPFSAAIARSRLSYIDIKVRKPHGLAPWNSKLGGSAYLLKGQPYPVGPDGAPLVLLAQLNFSEMPALAGYPSRGILQFFIAGSESKAHIYGMPNGDDAPYDPKIFFSSLSQQRWFRVIYNPQVQSDREKLTDTPSVSTEMMLPITGSAALSFAIATEPVSIFDYRFEHFLGKPRDKFFAQFGTKQETVATNYIAFSEKRLAAKMGGYSSPVQQDPRAIQPGEDWLVLLELQSANLDGDFDMMWGDGGMGVFYIRRDDLERLDFSNVIYYWDNH